MRFMTKTLEFPHIINRIKKYAHTDSTSVFIEQLMPMTSLDDIKQKLSETDDYLSIVLRMSRCPFVDDFDIVQLFGYGQKHMSYSIYELLQIKLFLSMEKDIVFYIREIKKLHINTGLIQPYFDQIQSHYHLYEKLNQMIDPEGYILDDASAKLLQIRNDLKRFDHQLQDRLNKLVNDYQTYLSEQVIVIRNDRFCLCVKEAFKNKIKGITHDISASGQTIYIEPEQSRQITAHIESLKTEEKNEIDHILRSVSHEIQKEEESLLNNLNIFVNLDFIQSKALYAKEIDGHVPHINRDGKTVLVKAKHPLLNQETAVPISLKIDQQYKILLITGPNTGGKTVALKTLGLLTVMTQSGILIPASEQSEIAVFNQIFADIGDEQSIEQSLSTFSSHLTKIIQMLKDVDNQTLIILDEIGSGTDPNEGVSLAIAILNAFKKYDVRMLVTTHYSELKHYAFEQPDIQTASVAFDQQSLKPLYYIQMGMTGSSQAFLIAQQLGLGDSVIAEAKDLYSNRQTDVAKMMDKLNLMMVDYDKQEKKLIEQNEDLSQKIKSYESLKLELIKKQDAVIEKIKEKEILKWESLRDDALKVIKDLEHKQSISKPESAQYKHHLNKNSQETNQFLLKDDIDVGDSVYIKSYQQYGIVKSVKNEKYDVKLGQFELTFDILDLIKDKEPKKTKSIERKTKTVQQEKPARQGLMTLDLRGYRFEDVYQALDQAVDQAIYSGLHELTVIHGFGTGAVKTAVHDYIKQSSLIKSHRFGQEGEGLNGVTIITLK
ncbi:MAG: endonuclease MutS2 [Acholeplasmataceae bacterium]